MSKLYDKLPVSQDIRDLFNNGRKKLNSTLDSKSLLECNNHMYTRKKLWKQSYMEVWRIRIQSINQFSKNGRKIISSNRLY